MDFKSIIVVLVVLIVVTVRKAVGVWTLNVRM